MDNPRWQMFRERMPVTANRLEIAPVQSILSLHENLPGRLCWLSSDRPAILAPRAFDPGFLPGGMTLRRERSAKPDEPRNLDLTTMRSLFFFLIVSSISAGWVRSQEVPQTVADTWALFDPKAEPLETEIIRQRTEDGIVLRQIRYVVGTFRGKKTRVAAFYALPQNGANLPAIVQLHGGGQRAQAETVKFWASHGYASVAVNWGENIIDQPDDPNTDWAGIAAGFHEPKHHNDVSPGEATLYDVPHPWNSSWLLYSAAARRALTFLEQQPEVDPGRMGLTGHSMGGRLTVLTAIDPRVKAASPSVGGSGYLYEDIWGVPGSARHMQADLDLYDRTIGCRSYWPLIRCPLLFLGATNDFNSPMEKVMQGFGSLTEPNGGLAFAPHMNHRFTSEAYASRVRWFEAHLKGGFDFPPTPASSLELNTADGIPVFTVTPSLEGRPRRRIDRVEIFYGFARDPRTRFWRAAEVARTGSEWTARCEVMELDEPLFAFANITYRAERAIELPRGYRATSRFTVTSLEHRAVPDELRQAGVKPGGERQRLIDDFRRGWQDWSLVAAENPQHWNFQTYKVNDPAFFGPRGAELAFEVETTAGGNTLAVVMETDRWRGYTGRKTKRYTALVPLPEFGSHHVRLPAAAFVAPDGETLEHYDFVTGLILTPGDKELPEKVKTHWQGKVPTFGNLRWEGGQFAPRPKPYLGERKAGWALPNHALRSSGRATLAKKMYRLFLR